MASKLYVGGLSFDTTEEELREFFQQSGAVDSASIAMDRYSGRSRGFGFVEMSSSEEARKAIQELNGKTLGGRTLTVEEARPPRERGGGFGERRGGGGGGRRRW
ncbi:MAG: RNA recognition motif domain-containing protein [Dehalococcoidia bacterium]